MKFYFSSSSPNGTHRWARALCTLTWLALIASTPALQLIHRYRFDLDTADLVGSAEGELVGDAAIADGAVVWSGNKPSYVNLPGDAIESVLSSQEIIMHHHPSTCSGSAIVET